MLSSKGLFSRGKQSLEVSIEPAEPVTIEGEQLAQEIIEHLRSASETQRSLIGESDELGRQMADLLAAKELGRPVDPESLIVVAERRAQVRQELEATELRISGLLSQQAALRETEAARRRAALLPQIEMSAELGATLLQQFLLQMAEVSDTIEAITANRQRFQSLEWEWDRVSPNKGSGTNQPRDVWEFFVPQIKQQATYPNPAARRTLAQQIEFTLFTGPAERRAEYLADIQAQWERHQEYQRLHPEQFENPKGRYLGYLKQKRHAIREGKEIEPYDAPIPAGMEHLVTDQDWEGDSK